MVQKERLPNRASLKTNTLLLGKNSEDRCGLGKRSKSVDTCQWPMSEQSYHVIPFCSTKVKLKFCYRGKNLHRLNVNCIHVLPPGFVQSSSSTRQPTLDFLWKLSHRICSWGTEACFRPMEPVPSLSLGSGHLNTESQESWRSLAFCALLLLIQHLEFSFPFWNQ